VDEITASSFHTCARAESRVFCWGDNVDRQLALVQADVGRVVEVELPSPARSIVAGANLSCALGADGRVRCWGSNAYGERGTTEETPSVAATAIPLISVTEVFAGHGQHLCARTENRVSCWGRNDSGQLGRGRVSVDPEPVAARISPLSGSRSCSNDG